MAGIADVGPLVGDIQAALQNCSHFDLDFQILNDWADQLKEPIGLSQKVLNNYLLHGSQIMANINQERLDW